MKKCYGSKDGRQLCYITHIIAAECRLARQKVAPAVGTVRSFSYSGLIDPRHID